jgi:N-acetylmuramate 1-kinase
MKTALKSLEDLEAFARSFLAAHPRGAIAGLTGGLGAGKTTFVRAIVRELCARNGVKSPKVISPTFVLHQTYPSVRVDHFDLYRLENATESSLLHIGYPETKEKVREQGGYLFVEWPELAVDCENALSLDVRIYLELSGETRLASWAQVTQR